MLGQHILCGVHPACERPRPRPPQLLASRGRFVPRQGFGLGFLAATRDGAAARRRRRAADSTADDLADSTADDLADNPAAGNTYHFTGSDGDDGTDAAAGARRDYPPYSAATNTTATTSAATSAGNDVARAASYTTHSCTGYTNSDITATTRNTSARPKRTCGGWG